MIYISRCFSILSVYVRTHICVYIYILNRGAIHVTVADSREGAYASSERQVAALPLPSLPRPAANSIGCHRYRAGINFNRSARFVLRASSICRNRPVIYDRDETAKLFSLRDSHGLLRPTSPARSNVRLNLLLFLSVRIRPISHLIGLLSYAPLPPPLRFHSHRSDPEPCSSKRIRKFSIDTRGREEKRRASTC